MPVLATATQDNVVLLTADLDFGGYIFRDHHLAPDAGIVLYRLDDRYSPEDKAAIVGAVFAARTADDFAHHFTVIEAVHVRARPLLWFSAFASPPENRRLEGVADIPILLPKGGSAMERQEMRREPARANTPDTLARLERRLEQRWRDLAMAEQRGQPSPVLERMYAAYLRELESYLRAQRRLAGHETHTRLAS